jgi:hypothetical protein
MAATEAQREGVPQHCSECGVLAAAIADWTAHTGWHAGGAATDLASAVAEFLDGIDTQELSEAALEHDPDDPIGAALTLIRQAAARSAA